MKVRGYRWWSAFPLLSRVTCHASLIAHAAKLLILKEQGRFDMRYVCLFLLSRHVSHFFWKRMPKPCVWGLSRTSAVLFLKIFQRSYLPVYLYFTPHFSPIFAILNDNKWQLTSTVLYLCIRKERELSEDNERGISQGRQMEVRAVFRFFNILRAQCVKIY